MKDVLTDVLNDVAKERGRQDSLHGRNSARYCGSGHFLKVLGEEFGEVCRAMQESVNDDRVDEYRELSHVAAVAVARMEQIKAKEAEKRQALEDQAERVRSVADAIRRIGFTIGRSSEFETRATGGVLRSPHRIPAMTFEPLSCPHKTVVGKLELTITVRNGGETRVISLESLPADDLAFIRDTLAGGGRRADA